MDAIKRAIELSLIRRSGTNAVRLHSDVKNILSFVEDIRSISVSSKDSTITRNNVMRDDEITISGGTYRESMLNQVPIRHKNWIAVKKFLR